MPLNNTDNDIIAQTKEDYQSILQALKNWEQDPELKKRVMEVHEVLTKPKEKKKKKHKKGPLHKQVTYLTKLTKK